VDLYFLLKQISLAEIVDKCEQMFGSQFNQKIFRTQLAYFEDIDYTEEVNYMAGFEVGQEEVKQGLVEYSLQS
jgi:hypothetical protein